MENLKITDAHGDSIELIDADRADRRVHLHVRHAEAKKQLCVHLSAGDQAKIHMWLGQMLGAATPAEIQESEQQALPAVASGPSVRLTIGEGEIMREVVWDGALPDVETFDAAARVLLTGEGQLQLDQDGRRARVIELRRENLVLEQQCNDLLRRLHASAKRVQELERELQQRMTLSKEQERRLIDARNAADDRARAAREALELAEDTGKELRAKLDDARAALTAISDKVESMGDGALPSHKSLANVARHSLEASNPDA